MFQFPGISVSVQQSSSERLTGHKFFFSPIVCQNAEYWCWWNSGSLWYFLACHSTILCKKVCHKFHTSSVDVFCLPGLWSSFMVTCPSRKWLAQRETVLRSAVCSPQTSCKALWMSVGFCHVKFQSWCMIFDLQPSQYPRCLQTPCLTFINSKLLTLGK
jgi:hypothetical protein